MNNERLMKVLLAPIVSEKTSRMAEMAGQVGFRVVGDATKQEVAKAVEMLFEVQVDSVRILNVKGKQKRFGQRLGKRQDWRKAYVRLKAGQDIDFGGGA
ncbi:50S ribosomal protein L23 [Imhoffiella purpurea]|uniref:Large ribosomal subunit protein uL23 n=1 Tax=Imhoffiella purpurea TaxID=1249627 RepID=W9V2F1_9GAMM|nr:50S ribosomal protein L23 [Imhoffiella purpurea]EXJ13678.1 LSU ribosomal protein L23p (L23Ae) [Imhoffiella purpurea]